MSSLTHFPLELSCEDYTFLNHSVDKFKYGLVSIFTDSIKTLDLDTSLDDPDGIGSSVSSAFIYLVSALLDNSKPQPAPSIKSHKFWCHARALLLPVSFGRQNVSL